VRVTGDRIVAAAAVSVRRRCRPVPGAEVLEIDGLVVSLSNLPEPSLNAVYVERGPEDPARALAEAEEQMRRRGHEMGIDFPAARFPEVDAAVRVSGLERIDSRPAMVAAVAELPEVDAPEGVRIRPVETKDDSLALAQADADAWDGDLEISERFFAPGVLGVEGVRGFVAWDGDEPVGCGTAQEHEGSIAIFGIGVAPRARRRGLGGALTAVAARAFPGDLAWLLPSEMARRMYERLGFRPLEDWEIWVRR
jgi:ribosomal protein S18 acetylase RimI-like enzyme